jgi:hypothetical protein
MDEILDKLSNGHKISASSAVLAVLFFFLPWIMVSCNGQELTKPSGWQLAAGYTIDTGFGSERIPGEPILFFVLIASLIVLGLTYLAFKRGGSITKLDGFGLIALGALSIIVMIIAFSGANNEANQQGIEISFLISYWGIYLTNLCVIYGGVLNLKNR